MDAASSAIPVPASPIPLAREFGEIIKNGTAVEPACANTVCDIFTKNSTAPTALNTFFIL
jgi:hypothetical protein